MEYWSDGSIWGGIFVSGYDPGTTKYWHDGAMYGDVFSTAGTPSTFTPIIMFFF